MGDVLDILDDEDDGYEPPTAVRVELDPASSSACPVCGKGMKAHGALDLLRCAEQLAPDGDDEDEDERHVYGSHDRAAATVSHAPAPPLTEFERWQRDRDRMPPPRAPAPPPAPAPAPEPVAETPPPTPTRHVLDPDWAPTPAPDEDEATLSVDALPAGVIQLPDGTVDLEALAVALRTVIERERDEVIRRGGPLEKQNQELKERLADALEQTALWRKRAQGAFEERNSYKDQLEAKIKEMRKARVQKQGDRSGERANVTDIQDILKIVRKTPGFEVKMGGNGHYQIYQDGVFVTDAASSGGSQKVNMATRVKLRKAGVNV